MLDNESPWRLVIFDLDGSALTPEKNFSPRFQTALAKTINLGVEIAFASGRTLNSVREIMAQLPCAHQPNYVIACNGALVWSQNKQKIIASELLDHEDIVSLSNLGHQLGCACYFFEDTRLMTDFPLTAKSGGYQLCRLPIIKLKHGWDTLRRSSPKMMFIETAEIINSLPKRIPDCFFDRYYFVRSEDHYYEVMKKDTHKGAACKKLAQLLNIPPEKIIAVGDELNDVEMLKYVGLGVAMGNACTEVKQYADWVTDTNQRDGAAKVLENYIINFVSP